MTLINTFDNKSYNLDFSYSKLYRSILTYNGIEYGDGTIFVGKSDDIPEESNNTGTAKGYTTGSIKNKITIQLAFGDGNIGSVTINGIEMTLPAGTQDRAEFEVEPANKYKIVVTKKATEQIKNPHTYDKIMICATLFLVSISGIVGINIYRKKKYN